MSMTFELHKPSSTLMPAQMLHSLTLVVLLQAGFTNVLHLEGGINQWRHDGFPVKGTQ